MRWACRRSSRTPSADPEALRNLDDFWIHGRHPSGRLIAAEVWEVVREECCVWDLETGDLVWRPRAKSIFLVAGRHRGRALGRRVRRRLRASVVAGAWADQSVRREEGVCNTYVACARRPRGRPLVASTEGGVNLVSLRTALRGISRVRVKRGNERRPGTNVQPGPDARRDLGGLHVVVAAGTGRDSRKPSRLGRNVQAWPRHLRRRRFRVPPPGRRLR